MPSSITRRVIGALALGMAAVAPALALVAILFGIAALVSGSGQEPVNAPQLSSTGTKSLPSKADFRLSDHQQLRRPFFGGSGDRLR